MEVAMFFGAVGLFFAVIFIREAYLAKKREKEFIEYLYEGFGGIPDKEYSIERYARMGSFFKKHPREGQLDDITWNDLGMDAVFKRMNYTFCAAGEEYLYYTLRTPKQSGAELKHFEDAVVWFLDHPHERVKVQRLMAKLGYMGKLSIYDYIDNLDALGERSNAKHYVADALFFLFLFLLPFHVSLGIMALVCVIIYNLVSYFREKNEIDPYVTSFSYVIGLLGACDGLLRLSIPVLEKEWKEIKEHRKKLNAMGRGSFLVLDANRSVGTGNPLDVIMDYLRMVFHVDLIKFNSMLSYLKNHTADVDVLIERVGYLETVIAVGAYRTSLGGEGCIPEVGVGDGLVLEDAYYPLIEHPVKNSVTADKGVLLTGSNASGKSTFLKTVAVNAVLAQTVHTCTAGRYKGPFFRIYSSMSLRDDLEGGDSYYIVEIKALKRILDAAAQKGSKVLCFVDEVLRGTNTVERIAASTQILKSLAGQRILCFAATHDIELTELLKGDFDNYHFEEDIKEGDIFFNYKLLSGKATTRNAIRLLEIMGYDEKIIERAMAQAKEFTDSGVWRSEA